MMRKRSESDPIDTIYGRFIQRSKGRLDLTYDYEAAEIQAFYRIAERVAPTLMLDIGANVGVYSIFLAGVEAITRIFAFEPAPAAYDLLEKNIALQDSSRLHSRNVALSDATGKAQFAVFGALAGNNALEETSVSATTRSVETIEVETVPLDDEVTAKGETFMCKIDVEGHELQVLSGASALLTDNVGILQIECFARIEELDDLLIGYNYARIFRLKHDYYYTNIADPARRAEIVDVLFDEVATALTDLKDERRRRRRAVRTARETFDLLRFGTDPVTGTRDPGTRRRAGKRKRQK